MRIIDDRKPLTNLFREVEVGQVFYVEEYGEYSDNPYMRTTKFEDVDGDAVNAVDLQDGQLVWVNDDEAVILCSATLKIY